MSFTIFSDVPAVIRGNSKLFPLGTFSRDFFDTLDLGFEVYKNSKYKKTGLDMEMMGFRECFEAIRGFHRRQNDVNYLTHRESWDKFSENAYDNLVLQKQLEETQRNFKNHDRFATHSNESLIEAYHQLISIERLLHLAISDQKAAKSRIYFIRLSKTLNKKYEIYLAQQWAVLKKEQEDIEANILNRLFLCSQDPSLENTDVLPDIIKQLKSKGLLKAEYTAPKISNDKLTLAQFYEFHNIILNSHNSEAIALLQSLPWLKKHARLEDRFAVGEWMPSKYRQPNFLFFNANLRYNWFKNYYTQAQIDVSLQYLHTQKIRGELTFSSLSHRMVVIRTAESAVHSELFRLSQAKVDIQKGFRKLFCRKTVLFLNKISNCLYEQYLLLISEKVNLLEFLSIASEENIENIDLARYMLDLQQDLTQLENYFGQSNIMTLQQKYTACSNKLKKILTVRHEKQLKDYLYQWTQLAYKPTMNQSELDKLHKTAQSQEDFLKAVLTEDWASRIELMQNLRIQNKFVSLEKTAQDNLVYLLGLNPVLLRESIRKELNLLKESLKNYIKTNIDDFDYDDQKHALARMLSVLSKENIIEAECSALLSDTQKAFLEAFPEVNFYINAMLKLKQATHILSKLYNPDEIEDQLNSIYKFIKRQETNFLNKSTVKFIDLFPPSKTVEQNRDLLNQLRIGVL